MFYTMADAKRDFRMNHIGFYRIERAAVQLGWFVLFGEGRNNGEKDAYPLVDARSRQSRLFKTLDAAVSAIEEVGFEVNLLS